uniref:Uncharacterized protein n=1 Tax=Moniliophthora roreri TaxID=221103 RepID=A0A0W0FSJ1_MONRR
MYNRGKELLGIVVELTERWEELELISSNRRFWRLPNITTRLTSLKRIALLPHTVLARSRPRSYVDPSIFHGVHVPFLHSVQNHDWILLDVGTFPWVQITKYEGSERSTSHLHILRCMTNLERCALEFLCGSTDLYSDSVTTLSRLLELRTCWFFDEQTWPLPEFRLFRFPALKSLSILAEDYPLPFITFTYILEQSNASLEKLELSSQVGHNRDDLVSFFHTNAMASVTTLRLWVTVPQQHELAIHGAIISLLVEGSLLPLLHTIEIVIAEPRTSFALDLVALAKTVRARKASGVGIRNLVIVHRQGEIGTGYSLPPILEVLQEEGLDVVVRLTDDWVVWATPLILTENTRASNTSMIDSSAVAEPGVPSYDPYPNRSHSPPRGRFSFSELAPAGRFYFAGLCRCKARGHGPNKGNVVQVIPTRVSDPKPALILPIYVVTVIVLWMIAFIYKFRPSPYLPI